MWSSCIILRCWVTIGDDYDEIIESLNRFAVAGKHLTIVPRTERKPGVEKWRWGAVSGSIGQILFG